MNGWLLGYAIGAVVVIAVVVLLLLMIAGARRVADQAEGIDADLRVARDRTAALRELATTSSAAHRIVAAAVAARQALTDGGGR